MVDLGREVENLTPAEGGAAAIRVLKAHLAEHPEEVHRVAYELRLTA